MGAMTTMLETRKPRTTRGAALAAAVAGPLSLLLASAQPQDGPPIPRVAAPQIRAHTLDHAVAVRIGTLIGLAGVILVLVPTAAFAQVVRGTARLDAG
jgi:hypothetical protein